VSYIAAFGLYLRLRRRFGDPIPTTLRWGVVAAAVAGAALGAKLLYFLEDPSLTLQNLHNPEYFVGGKTIVGALAGGLITVELIKRYIGLRASTGDLYAVPLAVGIAIGRVGCFLTGLSDNTYGIATSLPWGVNFGDGIRRHPTQLYEMVFLLALIPMLLYVQKEVVTREALSDARGSDRGTRSFVRGDVFKLFIVAYMIFRFFCDFLKPYSRVFLGLGGIQWACVLILLYYSGDVIRWLIPRTNS
jgi:phosphatidylglycerol---prolipoprotein diacylglyceryl transferase